MNVQEWLDNPKTIQKSKKGYAHFDYRIDITKAAESLKTQKMLLITDFIRLFIIQ